MNISEFYKNLDANKYPLLSKYTKAVMEMNRPVVGREVEEERILSSFCRPEISNVILLGDAGSGKTTLVMDLAKKDATRSYVEVDVARMASDMSAESLAGALKQLADETVECMKEINGREIVLFMDEIHQITKISEVALEALKPILANSGRRGIRIICATTYDEFDKYIAGNQALVERLQRISLAQPNESEVIAILHGMLEKYKPLIYSSDTERLRITDLFRKIYRYTNLYIPANSQPRKSIDVLDAMIGLSEYTGRSIDENLLADVFSRSYGVLINMKVDAVHIKEALDEKVFEQELATTAIQNALQVCVAKLNDDTKPMGRFLFTGSTGTGKTAICKRLAEILFNDSRNLIRMDMTEFGSDDSEERFREELTKKIWERPFSIVLLDEIEKASPLITRMLLPVLDDARLINAHNKEVSFKNAYIVMTTNAASEVYRSLSGYENKDNGKKRSIEERSQELMGLIPLIRDSIVETTGGNRFPPELLGRIDAIVPFLPLSTDTKEKIVRAEIKELRNKIWRTHGANIRFDESIVRWIVYDKTMSDSDSGGARAVISVFKEYITAEVAKFINENPDCKWIWVTSTGRTRHGNDYVLDSEVKIVVKRSRPWG